MQLHFKCFFEESPKDFFVKELNLLRDLHLLGAKSAWNLNGSVMRELNSNRVEVAEDHHSVLVPYDKIHQGCNQFARREIVGLEIHGDCIRVLGDGSQPRVCLLRELPKVAVITFGQLVKVLLVSIRVPLERVPIKHGD